MNITGKRKKTSELIDSLNGTHDLEQYFENNEDELIDSELSNILNRILEEKKLKKSDVIKNSQLTQMYSYQIFQGKRHPSRDKLICLLIAMNVSQPEIQRVLKIAGFSPLYPRNKRDCIIIFGINKGKSVMEINEDLSDKNQQLIIE